MKYLPPILCKEMLRLYVRTYSEGIFYMKRNNIRIWSRTISEYLFLWALGGSLYYGFEMLFRGFSHWSMFVLGGVCLLFITVQGQMMNWEEPIWRQITRAIIFVTGMEFITGIIVNKWFHLGVWDYSNQPLQIFGQICVPFMIIFSGLCAVGIFLSGYILHWFYGERRPQYHIL